MTSFEMALHKTKEYEGDFSNHKDDRGGPTKYGISARFMESVTGEPWDERRISAITKEQAASIYYEHFWLKAKCDQMPDLVDRKLFDTAVNLGITAAAKILQRAIRSVGSPDPIKDDGIVGRKTIIAAGLACQGGDSSALLAAMRSEQACYYRSIVARNKSQIVFLNGWLRRAYDE